MTTPLVSVILPVFNGEAYLAKAIESILSQTFENFELIIINDGSTDDSQSVINKFIDDRIKKINHIQNKGLVLSLNDGIKRSSSKYIARMDQDDISSRNRLQKQVSFLENNLEYSLLGSSYAIINKAGSIEKTVANVTDDHDLRFALSYKSPFAHGSVMMRASALKKSGSYNLEAENVEDYDLWLRLVEFGKIKNLPECLYFWRDTTTNISTVHKRLIAMKNDKLIKKMKAISTVHLVSKDLGFYIKKSNKYKSLSNQLSRKDLKIDFTIEYQRLLLEKAKKEYMSGDLSLALKLLTLALFINPTQFMISFVKYINIKLKS